MARKIKNIKPLVYVFCEGESEQEYARFLKEQFVDVVSIKYPSDVGRTAVLKWLEIILLKMQNIKIIYQ